MGFGASYRWGIYHAGVALVVGIVVGNAIEPGFAVKFVAYASYPSAGGKGVCQVGWLVGWLVGWCVCVTHFCNIRFLCVFCKGGLS